MYRELEWVSNFKWSANLWVLRYSWANMGDFHPGFFQMMGEWRDFTVVTKLIKNCKSLEYGFEGRCLNIKDICMDAEWCFKVHNLVSDRPKSIKLGQMTTLKAIIHMAVSVYLSVKVWNLSPKFPAEFRNVLFYFAFIASRSCLKRYRHYLQIDWKWHEYCKIELLPWDTRGILFVAKIRPFATIKETRGSP